MAVADYSQVLRIDPRHAIAYYNRGFILNQLHEHEKALADFSRVIRLKPDYAEAYYARGVVLLGLGEDKKANEDFAKAKELGYVPPE
jgi:tetratricopeptide (TPR) repeat protein